MKLVLQRAEADCGVAALATLLELPYEDVYLASAKVDTKARGRKGLWMTQVTRIARKLGITLTRTRKPLLVTATGILQVVWEDEPSPISSHLVAIDRGVVADPADGLILRVHDYLAREHCAARYLLERT